MSDTSFVITNQLLGMSLELAEKDLLPHLQEVCLTSGQVLCEPGTKMTDVYFPQNARLSLLAVMSDRTTIEVNSVGREGFVGLSAILGSNAIDTRLVVQISGKALKLPGDILKQEFKQQKDLQQLFLLYIQTRLNQISQIAVCHSHHEIKQRLASWILPIYDNTQQNTLFLTQKYISSMLGVRRASITETAISFQKQGIIKYNRGQITLLDRSKLEAVACECYSKIASEYQSLFKTKLSQNSSRK